MPALSSWCLTIWQKRHGGWVSWFTQVTIGLGGLGIFRSQVPVSQKSDRLYSSNWGSSCTPLISQMTQLTVPKWCHHTVINNFLQIVSRRTGWLVHHTTGGDSDPGRMFLQLGDALLGWESNPWVAGRHRVVFSSFECSYRWVYMGWRDKWVAGSNQGNGISKAQLNINKVLLLFLPYGFKTKQELR